MTLHLSHVLSSALASETMDVETEVQEFSARYTGEIKRQLGKKPQVPVKELRHIIPLLIMNLYGVKADATHKKSKG